ncbi:hypothetical protein AVEN_94288-1 [Araneus ventricosus]|uniref:RNase H type-1 domain-containing protein n=1 Tax=Araneus ventricosus TaxID=182803 RepID=A0A4Y2IIV2_ARAVE|nr:hypothetical protein AVEN_94288-1 [Araneus ventricosus]
MVGLSWVKAHEGIPGNELPDQQAKLAITSKPPNAAVTVTLVIPRSSVPESASRRARSRPCAASQLAVPRISNVARISKQNFAARQRSYLK